MKKMTLIRLSHSPQLKVAAYCRVSTDSAEQQSSLAAQQSYFGSMSDDEGLCQPVRVYSDTASGTFAKCRPGFSRIISDCRSGSVNRIVVKSISKFARNTRECLDALRELKRLGVTVLFEKEGIDTARVTDEMMITIMEGLAQEEAASISRNTLWSIRRKMAAGTLGVARVPFGYRKVASQLVPDEEKADIVRRIFSLYLSGYGARAIALRLNSEGVLSPTGGKWNNVTILKMLRQEKYIGDIHWQKTYSLFMGKKWNINHGEIESYYVRNSHPPIIDREVFNAVQTLRDNGSYREKKSTGSPFRGKTKCVCGRSLYFINGGYPSWVCTGKYDIVRPCKMPSFSDEAYQAAWERLCIKLKTFPDELIGTALSLLNAVKCNMPDNEQLSLQKNKDELSVRKYVLCSLCSQGLIPTEKLLMMQNEIDAETELIDRRISQLGDDISDTIEELVSLKKLVSGYSPQELCSTILKGCVSDGSSIEFELLRGLKLREVLI